jgi:hypothetical protein
MLSILPLYYKVVLNSYILQGPMDHYQDVTDTPSRMEPDSLPYCSVTADVLPSDVKWVQPHTSAIGQYVRQTLPFMD